MGIYFLIIIVTSFTFFLFNDYMEKGREEKFEMLPNHAKNGFINTNLLFFHLTSSLSH